MTALDIILVIALVFLPAAAGVMGYAKGRLDQDEQHKREGIKKQLDG